MTDSEVVDHGEMEGAPDPESEQVVTQNSQPEDGVEDAPTGNDPVIAHGLDQGGSEDAAADLASQYQNTLRAIAALVEPTMRRTALRERLEARPVEEVVWWIDQLLRGSLWGRELEMAAMLACSDWLIRAQIDDDYAFFEALYRSAHAQQNKGVLFLLRNPPPHSCLGPGARLDPVRLVGRDEVPTGTRRWMAVGQDRRVLRRLVYDPDPLVVAKLLANPYVQTHDVMSIVTRRPTTPDLLATVVVHGRWFKDTLVREALVQNPYIETGIAAKLLPTVPIRVLRAVAHSGDLHPHLTEAAVYFVRLRERRTDPLGV